MRWTTHYQLSTHQNCSACQTGMFSPYSNLYLYVSYKMHPWASWHFFLPSILRFSWNVTGPLSSLQDLTVMGHHCTTGRQGWSSSLATYITWGLLIILNIFLENRHLLTCTKGTLTLSLLKTCLVLQWFWFSLLFIPCIIAMDKS